MNTRETPRLAAGSVGKLRTTEKGCLRWLGHRKPALWVGQLVVLSGLLGASPASADPSIAGTWLFEVSFNGATCDFGETVPFTCSFGFMTFNADGTMAEVDTWASGAKQSWAAGRWQEGAQPDTFDTTFAQLQFNGTYSPSHYNTVWGPITYHAADSVDDIPEHITGTGKFVSYYFNGDIIRIPGFSGTFESKGYRMEICTDTSSKAQCKAQSPENFPLMDY